MTTRTPIHVYPHSSRYDLIRGPLVRSWLAENGIPAQWSGLHRGSLVRVDRTGDLLCLAQWQGQRVTVHEEARHG